MVRSPGALKHYCKVRAAMWKATILSLLWCCAWLCIHPGGVTAAPTSHHLLHSLRPSHPRLIMTASELERVRQMITSEPLARAWHSTMSKQAEKKCATEP